MSKEKNIRKIYNLEKHPSLRSWGEPADLPKENVFIECGWGRLIFGHTFRDNEDIVKLMSTEEQGSRDLAFYLRDPQVIIARAPQDLFIDPSYTFRLFLDDFEDSGERGAFSIRLIDAERDLEGINRIYQSRNMITIDANFLRQTYNGDAIKYWVAVDSASQEIIAVCMGIDHKQVFDDPENGTSIWSLAVHPQSQHPGIGIALVRHVAGFYQKKKRQFLDLSVLYTNEQAIALYQKLGFVQIPVFSIKNKNAINETLFLGPATESKLNPYSVIIINEARRRGLRVDVLDETDNYFRLSSGGRSIVCRESLSELSSAVAMSRCTDKKTTIRLFKEAGLNVPDHQLASSPAKNHEFLAKHKRIVVKPAVGEQGAGITVDIKTKSELESALEHAGRVYSDILLEEMVEGQDLRIIVINNEVVAAAVRKPPSVVGTGYHTILDLVKKQSRRRQQATQGESKIPIDHELHRTIRLAGYTIDDILPRGIEIQVRKAANLHVGGTIHDVTAILHPALAEAAKQAALVLNIPVVGLDFIVHQPDASEYVIIEANERPGLANHEPQPVAERFIDFLFPESAGQNP